VIRLHFGKGTTAVHAVATVGTRSARTSRSFGAFAPGTTYRAWDLYLGGTMGPGLSDPANSRTSTWAMFYLRDRYQNVRSIAATPCYGIGSCTDRRAGAFALGAVRAGTVDLVARRDVDTTGLDVVYKPYGWAWAQPLPPNLRLLRGQVVRVHPGAGRPVTDGRGVTHVYLGLGASQRVPPRGWIGLRSPTDETVGGWSLGAPVPPRLR
jgi:hypothetical protein